MTLVVCVVVMVGSLGAASGLSYSITKIDEIQRVQLSVHGDDGPTITPSEPGAAKNFLLVGVDSSTGLAAGDPVLAGREGEKNSDTIMILRVDPEAKTAAMLSLPRDLWVSIGGPNNGKAKINTALASGGPGMLLRTITDSLKIPIDHYIEIDLAGFKQLVAAINGVPMRFNYPTKDDATGLYQAEPGCVTMDADQGLAFARSRKLEIIKPGTTYWQGDGGDDRARARRQQEFIRAAIKKAISQGARNPATLNAMLDIGLRSVKVDVFLTTGEMIDLAQSLRDVDPAAIEAYEPITTEGWAGPAAVLYLDERASQPMFELFRGHNPLKDLRPFVRVEVRNATGERDKASFVGFDLASNNFAVTATRDDNSFRDGRTRILFADESERVTAVILARYLGIDVPIEKGSMWAGDSRVALIVGKDYPGLLPQPRPLEDFRDDLPPGFLPDTVTTTVAGGPTTSQTIPFTVPTSIVAGEIPTAPDGCD